MYQTFHFKVLFLFCHQNHCIVRNNEFDNNLDVSKTFVEYLNGCGNKSNSTNNMDIQSVANNSKSGIGGNRDGNTTTSTTTYPQYRDLKGTGITGTQLQSTSSPSNPSSSSNGNVFPQMNQSNPPIRSEGKAITVFSQSDNSVLLKPDSIHLSLIFSDDCPITDNVSINNWTMLETLVIGNRCCSSTKSFEIRDCPQLKSIKMGNQSFKYSSTCYIFGIEL